MTTLIDPAGLHLDDEIVPIGSEAWYIWLATKPKSFRFECPSEACIEGTDFVKVETASFTAVRAGKYWQAHKKADNVLRREHLGSDEKLTYDLMRDIACKISSDRYWENRRSEQKGKVESHKTESDNYETVVEGSSQAAENEALKQRLAELQKKYEREAENAARCHPSWRKLPGVESERDYFKREVERLSSELEAFKSKPSTSDLAQAYQAEYDEIKKDLPKHPASVTRDWVHFWRFKTWFESQGWGS